MASDRSQEGRRLSELAVARLQSELETSFPAQLIVLGGLVPTMLVTQNGGTPHHLGTGDADLLIHCDAETHPSLQDLERALQRIGFSPSNTEG